MEERRGRPKEIIPQESLIKYERVFEDEDVIETWSYDLTIRKSPINVDIKYKNGQDKKWDKMQKEVRRISSETRRIAKVQEGKEIELPITKRTWLAPSGKMVGYTRAKNLGLIK